MHVPEVMALLAPTSGTAHVIGLTGSPGVGKSTTTSALVAANRARGRQVGVIAVDPTSPFSGGALLGDRIRMQEHATDSGVFIRSMASRGHLGGLSATTPQAVRVLEAAGCDVILIETVGVGQSEVEVAAAADTTVVLLAPGMGDGIQAAKAGILEIADILCVNKADRDGVEATMRELRHMIQLGDRAESTWEVPVVKTVASRSEGIPELLDLVEAHYSWLAGAGELQARRERRAAEEINALVIADLKRRVAQQDPDLLDELSRGVVSGSLDPHSAAAEWIARVAESGP